MQNESISRIWGYVLLILMMIGGVFIFLTQYDTTNENLIIDRTQEFVNECQVTGKIDCDNYQKFVRSIQKFGYYDVTMEYRSLRYYPEEVKQGNAYVQTWNTVSDYMQYNDEEIRKAMFVTTRSGNKEMDFPMKTGDILTVVVKRQGSFTTNIFSSLFGANLKGTLVVRQTGTIGNNR